MLQRCFRVLAVITLLLGFWSVANANIVAGQQYQVLPAGLPPLAKAQPGKVVVTEFFSLACPHCFAEEPYLTAWLDTHPKDVVFQQIPVGFGNPDWVALAKAYFVAQALGKTAVMVPAIFKALHVEGLPLVTEPALVQFFTQYGVAPATFAAYYHSFSIAQELEQADQTAIAYGVLGVPTIVVNNHYLTNPGLAGGPAQLVEVTKALVAKVQA